MTTKSGMSDLETRLLEENKRLLGEVTFLKALLQDVGQHLVDVDGDDWYCMCCGERAPLSVDVAEFPHQETCALHKKQKV